MASYSQVHPSSAYVVLQGLHQLLLMYDPPRFHILLLLVSVSLVILVKAGFFNGDASHSFSVCEKGALSKPHPAGQDPFARGRGAVAVEVSCELNANKDRDLGTGVVKKKVSVEKESDSFDREALLCMISQDPKMREYEEDEGNAMEEGEELDVDEFHKRVEAYIHKVRMRFNTETIA